VIEFVWVEKEMESEYGLETVLQDKLMPYDCAITGCDGEYGLLSKAQDKFAYVYCLSGVAVLYFSASGQVFLHSE